MRIEKSKIEKHYPHIDDVLIVEDNFGNPYRITGDQLQDFLIEDGQMCDECFGSREVEQGEHDDIVKVPCPVCKGDE